MRICIFGASGACGIQFIRLALTSFPSCTLILYVRDPDKIPSDLAQNPSVIIIQGQLDDETNISKALEGVDVVVSALGPSTAPTKAVFYPSGKPLAQAYSLIIRLMHKHHVPRIFALGTASITDPQDKFSLQFSILVNGVATVAHNAYRDVVAIGETIRTQGKDLDWTIVRAPLLTDQDNKDVIAGYVGDGKTHTHLARVGFASFIVKEIQAVTPAWIKKAPLICSA